MGVNRHLKASRASQFIGCSLNIVLTEIVNIQGMFIRQQMREGMNKHTVNC